MTPSHHRGLWRPRPETAAGSGLAPVGRRRFLALTGSALAGSLAGFGNLSAQQRLVTIYFYSAESNINNFSSLKTEFDKYLAALGPYRFQPFSDRATFERSITNQPGGAFMMCSWHFRNLKDRLPIEPILIGTLKGRSMRRQVLCARRDIRSLAQLRGTKVASAATEEYARTMLKQLLERHPGVDSSVNVLTVPKDLDALMAVGFGLADAALAAEDGLTLLSSLNPKMAELLHPIATTELAPLPVVAVPRGATDDVRALVATLEDMRTETEGERRLSLIGLDGLRKLNDNERRLLQ